MRHDWYIGGNRIRNKTELFFCLGVAGASFLLQTTWCMVGVWLATIAFGLDISFGMLIVAAVGAEMVLQSPKAKFKVKLREDR